MTLTFVKVKDAKYLAVETLFCTPIAFLSNGVEALLTISFVSSSLTATYYFLSLFTLELEPAKHIAGSTCELDHLYYNVSFMK